MVGRSFMGRGMAQEAEWQLSARAEVVASDQQRFLAA